MNGAGRFIALIFIVLTATLAITSCHHKKTPTGVLTHAEMLHVLSEVYINEQKLARISLRPDSAKIVFDSMKSIVFTKAGTSDSVFKKSFDYYVEHPAEMELIYSALVDSLSLQEQRMDAK